jgi:hypothetical protein
MGKLREVDMISPPHGYISQNIRPCFTSLPLSGLSSGSTWPRERLHDKIYFTADKYAQKVCRQLIFYIRLANGGWKYVNSKQTAFVHR